MKANRKFRKPDSSSKLILKEIIGLTTRNGNGLAASVSSSRCAYVAGCVVVVYDVESGAQSHLMVSHRTPKPLCCVAMSRDGRFLAAGESGHQPAVLVWDCTTLAVVCELKGHLYGVECIAFSPDGEHLVSVGGYIYLWDWCKGVLVTKVKATSSCTGVTSVTFSSNEKFIVTAGKKHLRKFGMSGTSPRTMTNRRAVPMGLHGKPIDLGSHKGSSFISVTSSVYTNSCVLSCDQTEVLPIYALTDAGVLCLLDSGMSVKDSVDLKVKKGFALSTSGEFIACACSEGVVQLLTVESLAYVGSLLYSTAKNCQAESDLSFSKASDKDFRHLTPTLPDAVACQFSTSEKLVVVYGDHSLYIWDIHDVNKATRCCALVSHSACIWDIKNLCCENMHDPSSACAARGCSGGVSFATCSADGTIRLWDLLLQPNSSKETVDPNSMTTEPVESMCLVSAGTFELQTIETGSSNVGFRSLAVSSDGKYMAAGDSEGNLHIYDLENTDYTGIKDAHDAEILSLSFSLSRKNSANFEESNNHYLLASGGRDRTIHLFDVKRNFDLVESINDHSAAVTSVKLAYSGCKILSCSADRSLVFRDVSKTEGNYTVSRRHHQMASNGTVYDMSMDPAMKVVVTVGQDKKINKFDIASGKLIQSFKKDKDFGDPIKVTVDPSGSYLVCSYSNKSICLYDFLNGDIVAQALGHGEVVTGVIFLPDCKHIVSVSGDGCIFVWKLPGRLASRMLDKMKENSSPLSPRNFTQPALFTRIVFCGEQDQSGKTNPKTIMPVDNTSNVKEKVHHREGGSQETPAFKLTVSRLPKWAQAKVTSSDFSARNLEFTLAQKQVELHIHSPLIGEGATAASARPEDRTPAIHGSDCRKLSHSMFCGSSPNTNKSHDSTSPQESINSVAMDNRWLTVYTVCVDLLNSPEMHNLKDKKMPVSSLTLLQDQEGQPRVHGHGGRAMDDRKYSTKDACLHTADILQSNQCGHDMKKTNVCCEAVPVAIERLHSDKTGVEEIMDADVFQINSESSDLFKEHFGSLSTKDKIERRKSTARRFSSRYFVQRDYVGIGKRLFDINSTMLNNETESTINNTSEDPVFKVVEEPQVASSTEKDQYPTESSLSSLQAFSGKISQKKCGMQEDSPDMDQTERTDNNESTSGGNELEQKVNACREALLNLNTATENVFRLFSDLCTSTSPKELASAQGAQFCTQAAELLPSIAQRVNAVAKLVQISDKNSPVAKAEDSGLEPLLGTFAESLSLKVVEILKKNLNTI